MKPRDDGSMSRESEFVKTWTKIVFILAITLATLNGVNITPVI